MNGEGYYDRIDLIFPVIYKNFRSMTDK